MIAKLYARIIRNFNRISKTFFPKTYEFAPVSEWLNTMIADHGTYSIIFDGKNSWIFLRKYKILLKYLDKFNSISSILLTKGTFEETELDLVINNLDKDSVFFDVGANVGLYSIALAKKYAGIIVYAFEPVQETVREFQDNIEKNEVSSRTITIVEAAVTDQTGLVNITTDFHSSNYLIKSGSTIKHEKVKSVTIDDFVREKNITRIDLMKIDVEGNEYWVLKGAIASMKKFRPIIVMEITEKDQNFSENEFKDPTNSIQLLLDIGYKFHIIDDNNNLISMENLNKGSLNYSYHNYIFYSHDFNKDVTTIAADKRIKSN